MFSSVPFLFLCANKSKYIFFSIYSLHCIDSKVTCFFHLKIWKYIIRDLSVEYAFTDWLDIDKLLSHRDYINTLFQSRTQIVSDFLIFASLRDEQWFVHVVLIRISLTKLSIFICLHIFASFSMNCLFLFFAYFLVEWLFLFLMFIICFYFVVISFSV